MTTDAEQKFWREMDLRRSATRPLRLREVLEIGLRSGLSPREALLAGQHHFDGRRRAGNDPSEALSVFLSSLCQQSGTPSVLEYTTRLSFLTLDVAVAGRVFVVPDTEIAAALGVLSPGAIVNSVSAVPGGSTFDMILCQPAIAVKGAGDSAADGFGGEVVRDLVPLLADRGTLYWITARGVLWAPRAKKTLSDMRANGLNVVATIDTAPGAFPGTAIPGAVIGLHREVPARRFVGGLRDPEAARIMADALIAGPTRKGGPSWAWLDATDSRTFADLEQARVLQKLIPHGRHVSVPLRLLLRSEQVVRADLPVSEEDQTDSILFIPEYAESRVTADLADQTVKAKAVYRLSVDTAKANPRFLAQLLNSPYGRQVRQSAASGATIPRLSIPSLLSIELPLPDIATQDRIVRIDSDVGLMRTAVGDMKSALDHDWTALADVADKVDKLKGVLDIERQIADWWRELPYPLATIYRRHQVSIEPKERFETLLHFFEMAAVYLAVAGTSYVRAMRRDWQEEIAKWLRPPGSAGIERADFGFWIALAGASLKDTNRIGSDKELRASAIEVAGPELVQGAGTVGSLGKATDVLDVARRYRNAWKGHGGHMKASDAARLDTELQQSVRDLYEIAAPVFRHLQLVRSGLAEVTDTGFKFQIEKLSGSDPTFEKLQVELDRPAKTNALAFWMTGARTMCRALPFFRLGLPQEPQETSCYVFNRVEAGACRWISYQEAREQEVVAPDDELLGLIALGKRTN